MAFKRPCKALRSLGKSQKEGQEDQGTSKRLGRFPQALFHLPGSPGLPSGSSLSFLELPQISLRKCEKRGDRANGAIAGGSV